MTNPKIHEAGGLTVDIDDAVLPMPGEDVIVDVVGTPYQLLIVNIGEPIAEVNEDEDDPPGEIMAAYHYEVVDVAGATRTHAAIVRRRGDRTVVNRWALCSPGKARRVIGRRRDQDLSTVTCTQCRRRLVASGEL